MQKWINYQEKINDVKKELGQKGMELEKTVSKISELKKKYRIEKGKTNEMEKQLKLLDKQNDILHEHIQSNAIVEGSSDGPVSSD